MTRETLRIGDLSRETGKTVRALHYYEELGLLEPLTRTDGGFRLYSKDDVKRVRVISILQDLGLSLNDMREMVRAWKDAGSGQDATLRIREILDQALRDTREKIERLRTIEREVDTARRFLQECACCELKPTRVLCHDCGRGEHGEHVGAVPAFIDTFLH
jgi:DNA-binding transcriptional MerR regulator